MSKARQLHIEAMRKAQDAYSAKENGDIVLCQKLTFEAYKLESEAAALLFDKLNAEPTRSVLYRSAATLAFNCGEYKAAEKLIYTALAGNPPQEIETELKELFEKLSLGTVEEGVFSVKKASEYLASFREIALNIKLQPKTPKFLSAVSIDDVFTVLRNVKISYSNFLAINFRKTFNEQSFSGDFEEILKRLNKTPLLLANVKFSSFAASIASETLMTEYSDKIIQWKKKVFEDYKDEVFYLDYDSEESIKFITDKYNEDERKAIFQHIVDTFKETNGYTLTLTDTTFNKVEKKFSPVTKPIKSLLFPEKKTTKESKLLLFQEIGLKGTKDEQIKRRHLIESKKVDYAEFRTNVSTITDGGVYLVLNDEIEVNIEYREEQFVAKYNYLDISVISETYEGAIEEFSKAFINLYSQYYNINDAELSVEDKLIKEKLTELVFTISL